MLLILILNKSVNIFNGANFVCPTWSFPAAKWWIQAISLLCKKLKMGYSTNKPLESSVHHYARVWATDFWPRSKANAEQGLDWPSWSTLKLTLKRERECWSTLFGLVKFWIIRSETTFFVDLLCQPKPYFLCVMIKMKTKQSLPY